MKSYRKNGKIAVILKLKLPHSDGQCDKCATFDSFYSKVAERYLWLIEDKIKNLNCADRPVIVSVDFTVVDISQLKLKPIFLKKHKNLIVIEREQKINMMGEIRKNKYLDFYDTDAKMFVK